MPSPKTHSWRGLPNDEVITIAHITDCPTVTVHAGKCYQASIDSGAAISLIRHCTYKQIEDCYKTPIQSTAAKLNTTDSSPMTILGSTALHLCIADFKFTHNFIICNQLPDTELIFGIDIQKKFSLSYTWDMSDSATFNAMADSWPSHMPPLKKPQLGLSSLLSNATLAQWSDTDQDQQTTTHNRHSSLRNR